MIQVPNLEIDRDGDDPDTRVMLTQDFGGNQHMVTLHPCQVKLLAERMGLLAPDAEAQRTIARLSRQLRVLLHRIDHLTDWLHEHSDTAHADLSYEQNYSLATWELANEFVADLPGEAEPCARPAPAAAGLTSPCAGAPHAPHASHTASLFDAASPAAAEVRQ